MKRLGFAAAGLAAALAAGICAHADAAPLDAYGKLPAIEQAAISPDGNLVAAAATDGEDRTILVLRASDDAVIDRLHAGKAKIRALRWADSTHLLITSSTATVVPDLIAPLAEWYGVTSFNLKTGSETNLLENAPTNTLTAIYGAPAVRVLDGRTDAFVEAENFVDGEGRLSLFQIDLDSGRTTMVQQGALDTDGWLIGEDGSVLAESRFTAKTGKGVLRVKRGGDWVVADTANDLYGRGEAFDLGRDGRSVMVESFKDGVDIVREYDPEKQAWSVPADIDASADLIFDPVTDRPIGTHALAGDKDVYRFLAPLDQHIWDAVVKAFPGQRVTLQSLSADHKTLVVLTDSPVDGQAYAVVDIASGKAAYLGTVYELKAEDVSPAQAVAFKAADGLALTGYLTLPRGKDPKNLPLVVFPHGGPAARDEPGFDWWAQAMASRGYAVLQVNYRGSEGFGWNFLSAGFGQWGQKMQTDLSDGVRYLAAQGTIDPKRVCIVGASYGGYAALAGATLDLGVYRCAVSVAGVSDVKRLVAWGKDRYDVTVERYWDRYMGVKSQSDPHLAAISPALHVTATTVPILLIHGKDDTVVPFEQSQEMAEALRKAGQPGQIVVLGHEDHWLSHGDTRLQMLQATLDFLQKNNPAQ